MFFKVIDNVISDRYSLFLFDKILKLKWSFVPNLSHSNRNDTDYAGFSYNFYNGSIITGGASTVEPEYNYLIPMLLEAFDKFELNTNLDNIFRCRARLTIQKEKEIIESAHIDYTIPHLVLLYYINNTDGDTVFFDNDKIVERIQPKRGRCLLFDGSIVHSSSSSTLSPRIVLNTNILT